MIEGQRKVILLYKRESGRLCAIVISYLLDRLDVKLR